MADESHDACPRVFWCNINRGGVGGNSLEYGCAHGVGVMPGLHDAASDSVSFPARTLAGLMSGADVHRSPVSNCRASSWSLHQEELQ
jgi:hypothetical protein